MKFQIQTDKFTKYLVMWFSVFTNGLRLLQKNKYCPPSRIKVRPTDRITTPTRVVLRHCRWARPRHAVRLVALVGQLTT